MVISMKQARVGSDLSQEDAAKALEVHVNTYRKWEQNPYEMPVSKALAFCELTNVRPEDIFLGFR